MLPGSQAHPQGVLPADELSLIGTTVRELFTGTERWLHLPNVTQLVTAYLGSEPRHPTAGVCSCWDLGLLEKQLAISILACS